MISYPEVPGGLCRSRMSGFGHGGWPPIAVNVLFDHSQAFDHLAERAVHRFDGALCVRATVC